MAKKGNIPWNKGIKSGQQTSERGKQILSELRKIPVKRICVVCGNEFWAGNTAKYCSKKCRPFRPPRKYKRIEKRKQRIKTGLWNKWKQQRKLAIERDGGICQVCGKYIGNSIDIHHKDERGANVSLKERNDELDNLICLCHKCHLFVSSCLWYKKNKNWEQVKKLVL